MRIFPGTSPALPAEGSHAQGVAQPGRLGAARLDAVPQGAGLGEFPQELGTAPTTCGVRLILRGVRWGLTIRHGHTTPGLPPVRPSHFPSDGRFDASTGVKCWPGACRA